MSNGNVTALPTPQKGAVRANAEKDKVLAGVFIPIGLDKTWSTLSLGDFLMTWQALAPHNGLPATVYPLNDLRDHEPDNPACWCIIPWIGARSLRKEG